LAEEVENLDEQGQLVAGDVALRIVLWPPDQLTRERDGLIDPCRRVLDARQKGRPSSTAVARADGEASAAPASRGGGDDARGPTRKRTTIRLPIQLLDDVPGGALPVKVVEDPAAATRSEPNRDANANPLREEPTEEQVRSPTAAGPSSMPVRLGAQSNEALPLTRPGNSTGQSTTSAHSVPPAETTMREDIDVAGERTPRFEQIEGTTAGELMQLLHGSDVSTVSWARDELSRRGFSKTELRLAERLADPDPRVRRQWVRYLPGLRGVDAQQWLLWLSRDSDAEVRLTAITLMASTTNRELLDRLAELAASDTDARIRAQAERILQAAHGK
jgi:hypothetical protein